MVAPPSVCARPLRRGEDSSFRLVLCVDGESVDLGGGLAVTPTFDEGVEAGDEGFDVGRETSLAFDHEPLPFDDRVQYLLVLQMLLADAEVELRESFVLEPVPLAKESDHLLAGLAVRQAPESGDQRCFQVSQSGAHLSLEVGEARRQVVVQGVQACGRITFSHRLITRPLRPDYPYR